jgi:hypothetical protein
MEDDCIGSQGQQRTVVPEEKKDSKKDKVVLVKVMKAYMRIRGIASHS